MFYIRTSDNYYPLTESGIREAHPSISFSHPFQPEGYSVVFPYPQPAYSELTHKVVEAPPELTNLGHYEQRWNTVALDENTANSNKAEYIQKQWLLIKAIRDTKLTEGGFNVGQYWFHSDVFSRAQWAFLARKADQVEAASGDMDAVLPSPSGQGSLIWKTMGGAFLPLTANLIHQIVAAGSAQDSILFTHAESLRSALNEAQDPRSVNIGTGWPATFNG